MSRLKFFAINFILFCLSTSALSDRVSSTKCHGPLNHLWDSVKLDYSSLYTKQNLKQLGYGYLIGGVLANTNADQSFADWYQDTVRNTGTDRFAKAFKVFGNRQEVIFATLGAIGMSYLLKGTETGTILSDYTNVYIRTLLLAGPQLLLSQIILGGDRPSDTDGSRWRPFNENHGVSGHAFLGAVPFIVAAKFTRQPLLKALLYTSSAFTGFSRINDNKHYLSQVILGWWLAYLTVSTVYEDKNKERPTLSPFFCKDGGAGLMLSTQLS